MILDYMDGGSLKDIVHKERGKLSEEFIRWSLYQVALAI